MRKLYTAFFSLLKANLIKKVAACGLFFYSFTSSAQTFFGMANTPADNGANAGANATITPPASMQARDLVVVYAQYKATGASLSVTNAGGQTWFTALNNNSAASQTVSIFWCIFNGTWSANPMINSAGANGLTAVMYVYRPNNAANTWEIDVPATNTTSNLAANTITGITTLAPRTVTMGFWGVGAANTWTPTGGAGWTVAGLPAQVRNTSNGGFSQTAAYSIRTTAGAVASATQTQSASTNAQRSILAWREVDVSNNLCGSAISLTSSTACNKTFGTISGATYTGVTGLAASCGTANSQDVWYSFVAQTAYPTITLGDLGSNLSAAGARMYLYVAPSGCGTGFVELTCSNSGSINVRATGIGIPAGAGLATGVTYFVRVTQNSATAPTGPGWGFSICVTDPISNDIFDFGKSFINVSKNSTGGTVSVGDTLEIRATFVLKDPDWSKTTTGTADSLAFYDTLKANCGYRLLAGSNTITLKTNEGKIFRTYTNASGDDAAHGIPSGADTVIRVNFGLGASDVARGKFRNNTRPSVFGSTCIVMATYRVQVYAPFNSKIKWGGGTLTARDSITGIWKTTNFKSDTLIVYSSPTGCPNTVAVANAIGVESNGTFGEPTNPAPLARNRGTSPYVLGYLYQPFTGTSIPTAKGPGDYYYGIANNTSAIYSVNTSLHKKDSIRLFDVWDITGDHTNATNQLKGNPPCDTTLPKSATNPCGYMLVVNSSYKTDTAFQYSLTGLCPNTYYELSAWIKNVCSRCGCDSTGITPGTAGYIPTAPGDSSGVRPNLAFEINGLDYYTTGDILHQGARTGISPSRSDTANRWIKKAFIYKTGASETSFALTIRNNAPGGGGNDWAIDDIGVRTCFPSMTYSPSSSPNICDSTTYVIRDTVRSAFDNYTQYKWQRWSAADSGPWVDIGGSAGTGTPVWNATLSTYQYVASYTIPIAQTQPINQGDRYRLVVATTASNLTDANCVYSDPSIIEISINTSCLIVASDILSITGRFINNHAKISWTTVNEENKVKYRIERSDDGVNFQTIATVPGTAVAFQEKNYYNFDDPTPVNGAAYYRIGVINALDVLKKYSRTIVVKSFQQNNWSLESVVNPFKNELQFEIKSPNQAIAKIELMDNNGRTVGIHHRTISSGTNLISIYDTGQLQQGIYFMKITMNDTFVIRKIYKSFN